MIGKPQDHTQSNLNANCKQYINLLDNQLRELFKDRKSLL